MLGGLVHEQALTLARDWRRCCPAISNHVFFSDSGSVAVEVAMKMAAQYWLNRGVRGRTKFLAFSGGYHGDTHRAPWRCAIPKRACMRCSPACCREHPIIDLPRDEDSSAAFDAFLERHADKLAGIIVEPLVQGAGGMMFHDAADACGACALRRTNTGCC